MEKEKQFWGMSYWDWAITLSLMLLISILAIVQTIRGREGPFKKFIERAPQIGQALDAFARDHGGCFPDDGMDNSSPPGLSPKYIQWMEEWNIDYEAHDNGRGGKYIALEYLGPYQKGLSYHARGLTRNPTFRQFYGKGQRIPGEINRIWVFYEQGPIFQP